jgi:hypothetical protein
LGYSRITLYVITPPSVSRVDCDLAVDGQRQSGFNLNSFSVRKSDCGRGQTAGQTVEVPVANPRHFAKMVDLDAERSGQPPEEPPAKARFSGPAASEDDAFGETDCGAVAPGKTQGRQNEPPQIHEQLASLDRANSPKYPIKNDSKRTLLLRSDPCDKHPLRPFRHQGFDFCGGSLVLIWSRAR